MVPAPALPPVPASKPAQKLAPKPASLPAPKPASKPAPMPAKAAEVLPPANDEDVPHIAPKIGSKVRVHYQPKDGGICTGVVVNTPEKKQSIENSFWVKFHGYPECTRVYLDYKWYLE